MLRTCAQKSIDAARRLGYRAEGVLYNDVVQEKHGRWSSRDSAYLSILDREWHGGVRHELECAPNLHRATIARSLLKQVISFGCRRWLEEKNFDTQLQQRYSLSSCIAKLPCLRPADEPCGWPWARL